MSINRSDLVLAVLCAAAFTSCATSGEAGVPLGDTDNVTDDELGDATADDTIPSGGRRTRATGTETSVGTRTAIGDPTGTGGQLNQTSGVTTGGEDVTATGGSLAIWDASTFGGAPSAGGVNSSRLNASGSTAAVQNGGATGAGVGKGGATGSRGGTTRGSSSGGANGSGGVASSSGPLSGGGNSTSAGGNGPTGVEPVLPPVQGTCPVFKTGTVTAAGLDGISLQVGAKKQGTGSLLFYWHGTGSSAAEVSRMLPASVKQEILDQGGIIASFEGSLGTGGDCSGTAIFSMDDFKAADLIAACAVKDHAIDPRRIYTTGCSAGGLQSGCMAALRSSYLAAAAPNSGGEVFPQTIQDKSHVPAMMTMHGGAADWVVVSFSDTSATCDEQMKGAGGFVVNCNHGGGHCGAPSELYVAAWEFMKAHPFGVKPEPYAAGLPTGFPDYCQIY